jgi:RecA/RadA recombinase
MDERPSLLRKPDADEAMEHLKDALQSETEDVLDLYEEDKEWSQENLIPTGSTQLNLACSDNPFGGYGMGRLVNLIGDSSAGKTMLALTCFAELNKNPAYDGFDIYYDEPESALGFNMDKMFGKGLNERIKFQSSDTIQDFYINIYRACKTGRPFGYILDSFDALTSKEEKTRIAQMAKGKGEEDEDDGKKEKGTYGMEKQKLIKQILRVTCKDLKHSDSFLIIISQTIADIGKTFGKKVTRAGGNALKFFATHEIWLSMESHETKTVGEIRLETGVNVVAKVSKNKITGKVRYAFFPIYYDYGIDDIGSCIDFLVDSGEWKKTKQTINAHHFDMEGTKPTIIEYIESNNLEYTLQSAIKERWDSIEELVRLGRKPKY